MENQDNIKIFSSGCRLNALESEKIKRMLVAAGVSDAIIFNTCAVTHEALRQSRQQFRKIQRENPTARIFITGCGATMSPDDFAGAIVVPNERKFDLEAYIASDDARRPWDKVAPPSVDKFEKMEKKGFVQIGDGCDRHCTYCITRVLRGRAISFPYDQILADAAALVENGYEEIILTGVNIADWELSSLRGATATKQSNKKFSADEKEQGLDWIASSPAAPRNDGNMVGFPLINLCKQLLADLPDIKTLTLSSLDPAADIIGLIEFITTEPRMNRHLHLSVQSGSDEILAKMARRHRVSDLQKIWEFGHKCGIVFSWDIICGFPGETEALFSATLALARELRPIKIHAFPFSARIGTPAFEMPGKISRAESKRRVNMLINAI